MGWNAPATRRIPSLIGVIHLDPLPGSPRHADSIGAIAERAAADARTLATAGFDAVIVENFGDAPFFPNRAPSVTVASMAACAIAVRAAAPSLELGINVLRNDAESALAIAVASSATMIRVNVHTGARVTDQGVVQGLAHETLRARRALDAERIAILCDVDVKHSAPLAARVVEEEAEELAGRGLADALLVTGSGTGAPVDLQALERVVRTVRVPVLVASGATAGAIGQLLAAGARGVIVGSNLRADGRAGGPIDARAAARFAEAFRAATPPAAS